MLPITLAAFLSISIRLQSFAKASLGFTEHALYVPCYIFLVIGIFWAVVTGTRQADAHHLEQLALQGWLFTLQADAVPDHQSLIGTSWNYWKLFDFSKVKWFAMASATQDIVLLVVIGVLNLPIYIPAMAISLDVPSFDMDHELLGHGVSNLFAGAIGTIPNLVVGHLNAMF